MLKNFAIFIFSCFLCVANASAYEFAQIEKMFDLLQTEYHGSANLKELSLNSWTALTKFDSDFRVYNSDSKAFLYEKNNLIGTFDLPTQENPHLWKQVLSDIIKIGAERSVKISQNPKALENEILNRITQRLDRISHLENSPTAKYQLQYSVYENVLYIKADTFYAGISSYIKKIILSHSEIHGIILDMRNNRGGDFNEAIKTAGLFLDNGLITYSETRNHPNRYYTADKGDILNGKPIAVLTNELTASAAEIVTAALGEQSRAVIIGTKTFGKDSIQRLHKLGQNTLFLTYGTFYTPSGNRIRESGISPQICTGIDNSCKISDKSNLNKDIRIAVDIIKKNLS